MNILNRFGSGSKLYTFPTDAQVSYSDNFASLVTKTVRLAGVNGGFSNLGMGRGLSPIGTVRADIWLTFNDYADATDKMTSLRQMADWGVQPLYRRQLSGVEQFCFARVTDIQIQQNVINVPHERMKIPVTFEVSDPFWYRPVSGFGFLWDDGTHLWDDGSKWDSDNTYTVNSSLTQSFTNPGNTYTLPHLFLTNASGSNVGDIQVQTIVDGAVEDQFNYSAPLATATYLDVDPVRRRVTVGPTGTNALDDFTAFTPDWIRLRPGTNSVKVTCSGTLTLIMQYLERNI